MTSKARVDIALFGASGYVGELVAGYLARSAPEGARIALAGRSGARLAAVRRSLGARAANWPLLVADAGDDSSIRSLAKSARVVATAVGPYEHRGIALVEACAAEGTHYADLTGEVLFMRESIDRANDAAVQSGARIVHTCGFDSIPSDLGVLLLHERAHDDGAGHLEDTTFVLRGVRGGVSGGTVATLRGYAAARKDPVRRRVLDDPYALSPDRSEEPALGDERDPAGAGYDRQAGSWVAPFVMALVNTRVVRRSNAIKGWAYGRRFRYRELMGTGNGPLAPLRAGAVAGGLAAFMRGMEFGPTNVLLSRVLPDPGEGPSAKTRQTGFFRIDILSRTSSGRRYIAHVAAEGDPGYGATSVMFGESALCLALDGDALPARAGVLTPATAMGAQLAARLRAAGQTLTVELADPVAPVPAP